VEQRISIITLGVANLKRSREFYERLDGGGPWPRQKAIVFFQAVDGPCPVPA